MNKLNTIKETRKITYLGAAVNIGLSGIKISVGLIAGSQSLVADGVHSISDLVTDAAIIIGSQFWSTPPDKDHPYGHGRIETMVNIFIGIALFVVAGGIGWNAIQTIAEGKLTNPGWLAFFVALISIGTKEYVYRKTLSAAKRIDSRALLANAWHHRTDALSSVPVALAVVGGKLFPQIQYLDQIAAILVTIMIFKAAWNIVRPSIKELLEFRSDDEVEKRIEDFANSINLIKEIHKIRSRRIGSSILIDLHMLFDPVMTVEKAHAIAEEFSAKIKEREKNVEEIIVHIEPFYGEISDASASQK